jgi:hypothetical protein
MFTLQQNQVDPSAGQVTIRSECDFSANLLRVASMSEKDEIATSDQLVTPCGFS